MKKLLTLFFFFSSIAIFAQTKPCGKYGTAKNHEDSVSNVLKNRPIKSKYIKNKFTIDSLLNDSKNLSPDSFVVIAGYLVDFKVGGKESCNCGATADSLQDTHIYIGKTPTAKKEECVVVETTPRFKKLNRDLDLKQFVGKRVKVYGYLYYDSEHKGNAKNTCNTCKLVWRKTLWEIHPVVKLELIK